MTTKGTDNRFRSLTVVGEAGTPSTPASGDFKLYVADDGTFYLMDDTGTPTALGGGGFSDPMTTRGDIIVRNASNVTARLAVGSAGKVLSSDGTDVSWQTPASSGALVLLEQHAASNSAQLDFTSFISATYDEYRFELMSIIPATNAQTLRMIFGTGGGPTYDTGANYQYATNGLGTGNAAYGFAGVSQSNGLDIAQDIANAADYGFLAASLTLYDPQSTTVHKGVTGLARFVTNTGPTGTYIRIGGGYQSLTAVTAIRFKMSSGNITSGTIRVYGVAK